MFGKINTRSVELDEMVEMDDRMTTFARENKPAILSFLLREAPEALDGEKCREAKYLLGLGFKIDPHNPQVLALREIIYSRCPNESLSTVN